MDEKFFCSICVAGIVLHEGKYLLVRHTYGRSKGKYLIPGGYVKSNETPTTAIMREIFEETKIRATVRGLVSMRFKLKQWCAIFLMDYVNGIPQSDNYENDSAIFVSKNDLEKYELTDFTRYILEHSSQNINNKSFIELKKYRPSLYTESDYQLF